MRFNERQKDQLNQIGARMPANTPENRGAFRKWKEDVACFLFENYVHLPDSSDVIAGNRDRELENRIKAVEDYCTAISAFDPTKGSFANYTLRSLKINKKEAFIDGTMKGKNAQEDSISVKDQDGEETETDISVPDDNSGKMIVEAYTSQMTAMILNYWSLFRGKKGSADRNIYFPMWYSEKTKYLQETGCTWENTADVVRALDFNYLGFFLDNSFSDSALQTWRCFSDACLKGSISVPSAPEPITVAWNKDGWLPSKVPQHFLLQSGRTEKLCADSTISEQRTNYLLELQRLFMQVSLLEGRIIPAKAKIKKAEKGDDGK